MKQQKLQPQSGLSAIIIAMVFVIVLSLLSVGFATLVRNDQRQTLDKSLSYQAQYAAETAVNQVAQKLFTAPNTVSPTNCADSAAVTSAGITQDIPATSGGVAAKITCLTWSSGSSNIVVSSIGTSEPFTSKLTSATALDKIEFYWTGDAGVGNSAGYAASTSLPSIDSAQTPVLRIALSKGGVSSQITSTIYYLVPTSGGCSATATTFNQANTGTRVSATVCTDPSSGISKYKATISGYTGVAGEDRYISVLPYGGNAKDVVMLGFTNTGAATGIGNQAEIDANARALDVTKRIVVRVPLGSSTWTPAYAAAAEALCKDYRANGQQDRTASSNIAIDDNDATSGDVCF